MKVYTVSQLNQYLKGLLENDLVVRRIFVRGEVTNLNAKPNSHIYFDLKDENALIPVALWRGDQASALDFTLQNGMAIVMDGRANFYEAKGQFKLVAKKIQMDGDGAGRLKMLYEQLKQRLNEEGLFDFERKKPIPKFPKRVGIVTSQTAAALGDIRRAAERRNPYVELILYPAKVQGEGAAETIAAGIRTLDRMGLDTIIVGRGGGSSEDLNAFNEEIVVRAVADAVTPIISATGHERDVTLADYAADLRAATPTAAAELAIPDVMTTLRQVREKRETLDRLLQGRLRLLQAKLVHLQDSLEQRGPAGRLKDQKQRYGLLQERLAREMQAKVELTERTLEDLSRRTHLGMSRKYELTRQRAALLNERLNGLSPTAKLVGGFGYVSKDDAAVQAACDVKPGDRLQITMHDGTIDAVAEDVHRTE